MEFIKLLVFILSGLGQFLSDNIKGFFSYVGDSVNKYIEELAGIAVCSSTVHLMAGPFLNIGEKIITGIIAICSSLLSAYLINKLKPFWNRKNKKYK